MPCAGLRAPCQHGVFSPCEFKFVSSRGIARPMGIHLCVCPRACVHIGSLLPHPQPSPALPSSRWLSLMVSVAVHTEKCFLPMPFVTRSFWSLSDLFPRSLCLVEVVEGRGGGRIGVLSAACAVCPPQAAASRRSCGGSVCCCRLGPAQVQGPAQCLTCMSP